MVSLQSLLNLVRYNCKITAGLNIATAFVIILAAPVIFSLTLLEQAEMAKINELYISITGIILFTFLGRLDERENVYEIVYSKRLSHVVVFLIRVICMMFLLFLLIGMLNTAALLQGSSFRLMRMIFGTWISGVFLGMIGLTVSSFVSDSAPGYLAAFTYYGFEFFSKGKYTGDFYLFSLLKGSFKEKYRILALLLVLLAVNCVYAGRKAGNWQWRVKTDRI